MQNTLSTLQMLAAAAAAAAVAHVLHSHGIAHIQEPHTHCRRLHAFPPKLGCSHVVLPATLTGQ
jgi:hypothetical protein